MQIARTGLPAVCHWIRAVPQKNESESATFAEIKRHVVKQVHRFLRIHFWRLENVITISESVGTVLGDSFGTKVSQ